MYGEIDIGYDWRQPNPSESKALPMVVTAVFEGTCAWMTHCSLATKEMLDCAEELYRSDYPKFFNELTALSIMQVHTPNLSTDDIETAQETMRYLYRGAAFTIRVLQASGSELSDLGHDYADRLQSLDEIDLEMWWNIMSSHTGQRVKPLVDFIEARYSLLDYEPDHLRKAMKFGACLTYALFAHSRACVEREKELAWEDHLALKEARQYTDKIH